MTDYKELYLKLLAKTTNTINVLQNEIYSLQEIQKEAKELFIEEGLNND